MIDNVARVAESDLESVPEQVVRVAGVQRTYRLGASAVHALKGVDLEVIRGTMVALMGRSGSGKTTLLNLLGGLDMPDGGDIWLTGQHINKMSDDAVTKFRRMRVGFVFQSFALLPVLSAFENVELPMHIAGTSRRERHRRTRELLDMVGLVKRMHHRPFELSGGEQQRVAIARALANRPAILLADEPTGELDSVNGLAILRLFHLIAAEGGVTVILATHDSTAAEVADVTYDLVDGVLTRRAKRAA
jgi:ABC-type lipoprotein export system ATPase subunit